MKMHKSFIFRYVDRDILESDHRKAFLFDTLYAWMHYIEGMEEKCLQTLISSVLYSDFPENDLQPPKIILATLFCSKGITYPLSLRSKRN